MSQLVKETIALAQRCAESGDVDLCEQFQKRFWASPAEFAILSEDAAEAHLQAIRSGANVALKLGMSLGFDLCGASPDSILSNLNEIASRASAEGMFTAGSEAELSAQYTSIVGSLDEDDPAKFNVGLTISAFYVTDDHVAPLYANLQEIASCAIANGWLTQGTDAELSFESTSVGLNNYWPHLEVMQHSVESKAELGQAKNPLVQPDSQRNLQMSAMYLFKGFLQGKPQNRDPEEWGGEISMADFVAEYAPLVAAVLDAADAHQFDYDGVFEYEVTEALGTRLCDREGRPSQREFAVELLAEAAEFFADQDIQPLVDAAAQKLGVQASELQSDVVKKQGRAVEDSCSPSI